MVSVEVCCNTCKKNKTMKCPNSSKCYSLGNKPYWTPIDFEYKIKLNPILVLIRNIRKSFKILK